MLKNRKLSISFILLCLFSGILLLLYYYLILPKFTSFLVDNIEQEALRHSRHLAKKITDKNGLLTDESVRQWTQNEEGLNLEDFNLQKIKVFKATGEVVFSTDPGDVGEINKETYFRETVARGEIFSNIVLREKRTMEGELFPVDVLELYVPIISDSLFQGAFELYYDITQSSRKLQILASKTVYPPAIATISLLAIIFLLLKKLDQYILRRKINEVKLSSQNEELTIHQSMLERLLGEVEQSSREMEAVMNCMGDMVLQTDSAGNIKRFNSAVSAFTGKEDLIGKKWMDILAEQGLVAKDFHGTTCEYYQDSSGKFFNLSINPLLGSSVSGDNEYVISLHDMTEIKQIEEVEKQRKTKLNEVQNMLEQGLADVSSFIEGAVIKKHSGNNLSMEEDALLRSLKDIRSASTLLVNTEKQREEMSKRQYEELLDQQKQHMEKEVFKVTRELDYFDSILSSMSDALLDFNPDGTIRFTNEAARNMLGYSNLEIIFKNFQAIFAHVQNNDEGSFLSDSEVSDKIFLNSPLEELVKIGIVVNNEAELLHKDGYRIPVLFSGSVIRKKDSSLHSIVCVAKDITERKEAEEKLRKISVTDELTGLFNRRGFMAFAAKQLKIANHQLAEGTMFMLFADLDRLKWVNDNLGHEYGDQAIREAGTVLTSTLRESDVISRLAGDEFAALLTAAYNMNDEAVILERLQANIDKLNKQKDRLYSLSISFGLVRYDPDSSCSLEELMAKADGLMYENKKKRRT